MQQFFFKKSWQAKQLVHRLRDTITDRHLPRPAHSCQFLRRLADQLVKRLMKLQALKKLCESIDINLGTEVRFDIMQRVSPDLSGFIEICQNPLELLP